MKKILILLLVFSFAFSTSQSSNKLSKKSKHDFQSINELTVTNKYFCNILDSIIQMMEGSKRIKGKFLVAEFNADSVRNDLFYVYSEGDYMRGGKLDVIGYFNYKSKIIFVKDIKINKLFFYRTKNYKTFNVSPNQGVTYDKKGMPIFNYWIFYELWASWVIRYKDDNFKLLAFCTNSEEDEKMCFDRRIVSDPVIHK